MTFNYGDPGYRKARAEALERSGGLCQFCGVSKAEHTHHWKHEYDSAPETTPDHLTALCRECHQLAHWVRRLLEGRQQTRRRKPRAAGKSQRTGRERSQPPPELLRFARQTRKR